MTGNQPSFISYSFQLGKQFILGIPRAIKTILTTSIISAVIANILHVYLLGWVNDGFEPGENKFLNDMILVYGNEGSPQVLLFYILLSYIFWWTIRTMTAKGPIQTLKNIATTPLWLYNNLRESGADGFPQLTIGITASLILGILILTPPTSLTLIFLALTILFSQETSITLYLIRLLHRDLTRKNELTPIHVPVNIILGAIIGAFFMVYIRPNEIMVITIAVITVIVSITLRRRKSATPLLLLAFILVPCVCAHDGGIRESGGVEAIGNNELTVTLIEESAPASVAAALGATLLALFSNLDTNLQNTLQPYQAVNLPSPPPTQSQLEPPFPVLETPPPELPQDGVQIADAGWDPVESVVRYIIDWDTQHDGPLSPILEAYLEGRNPPTQPENLPEELTIPEEAPVQDIVIDAIVDGQEAQPDQQDLENINEQIGDQNISAFGSGGGITQALGGGINAGFIDQVEDEIRGEAAAQGLQWLRAATAVAQGSTRTGGGPSPSRHQMPGINSPLGPGQTLRDAASEIGSSPGAIRSLEGIPAGAMDVITPDVKKFIEWMKIQKKDSIGHQSYIRFMEEHNRIPNTSDPSDVETFREIYQELKEAAEP